jgi:endonuclease-8
VPEGDTIHRAARNLDEALAGKVITRFKTMLPKLEKHEVVGRTIERVHAVGKHLLIEISGGIALHTHMRMNGEWHIYRPREKWMRPRGDMRIVIETNDWIAVAFNVTVADFERPNVGPDLLAADFDVDEAFERLRAHARDEIGNALLDQNAMSGIGNIWKSETLFACRVNPFALVEAIADDKLHEIIKTARKLLWNSVDRADRNRWHVYSRGGQPCRKCGAIIQSKKQGDGARVTYWCPTCQIQ